MDRGEVYDIVRGRLKDYFVFKECPVCGDNMIMVKFEVDIPEDTGGTVLVDRFRCMGCLKVFGEELREVG